MTLLFITLAVSIQQGSPPVHSHGGGAFQRNGKNSSLSSQFGVISGRRYTPFLGVNKLESKVRVDGCSELCVTWVLIRRFGVNWGLALG